MSLEGTTNSAYSITGELGGGGKIFALMNWYSFYEVMLRPIHHFLIMYQALALLQPITSSKRGQRMLYADRRRKLLLFAQGILEVGTYPEMNWDSVSKLLVPF